jgi:6-phosphogluconolactonase
MVTVYDDYEALSLAAAELFAEQARLTVGASGRFNVLLSGGETPRRCYQLLGQEPLRSSIPWQAVHFFWGDERYVPADSPLSNLGMTRQALLDQVPLHESQVHAIPYAQSPHGSALEYETQLHDYFGGQVPRFDLVFLGLGEDGHTASLFPASALLEDHSRWVREVYLPEQDLYRVTVTTPVLNQSALVVFLVSGGGKAAILHQVLEGALDPQRIPAQLIKPARGRLLWLADRDAARLLSERLEVTTT